MHLRFPVLQVSNSILSGDITDRRAPFLSRPGAISVWTWTSLMLAVRIPRVRFPSCLIALNVPRESVTLRVKLDLKHLWGHIVHHFIPSCATVLCLYDIFMLLEERLTAPDYFVYQSTVVICRKFIMFFLSFVPLVRIFTTWSVGWFMRCNLLTLCAKWSQPDWVILFAGMLPVQLASSATFLVANIIRLVSFILYLYPAQPQKPLGTSAANPRFPGVSSVSCSFLTLSYCAIVCFPLVNIEASI